MTRAARKAPAAAVNMAPPPRTARPSPAWRLAPVRLATRPGEDLPDMPAWVSPCGRVAVHRPAHADAGRDLICAVVIGGRAWRVGTATASHAAVAWASRAVAAVEDIGAADWRDADSAVADNDRARGIEPIRRAFIAHGAHVV